MIPLHALRCGSGHANPKKRFCLRRRRQPIPFTLTPTPTPTPTHDTQVVGLGHWAKLALRSIQLEHWMWMCRRLCGKRLQGALSAAGYVYPGKEAFYADVWHSVDALWAWQEACGHTGHTPVIGDIIYCRDLPGLVGHRLPYVAPVVYAAHPSIASVCGSNGSIPCSPLSLHAFVPASDRFCSA